ncbi:MAG TPA: molybdopterin-dependent oxidoreductase [Dehalococcoidia bacterium]|nr:molybdopterin-dependent oxidoreductase [Dehalococcoidia bacterium]
MNRPPRLPDALQAALERLAPALAAAVLAVAALLFLRHAFGTTIFPEIATDALTDFLPLSLISWSIDTFGGSAKAYMFAGVVTSLVALGTAVPLLAGRWLARLPAWQVAGVLAGTAATLLWLASLVLLLASAAHLGASERAGYVLGTLAVAAIYGAAFALLTPRPAAEPASDIGLLYSRRHLLRLSVDAVAVALAGLYVSREVLGRVGGGVQRFLRGKPTPAVTSTSDFYVVSKNLYDPDPDIAGWSLRVDGLVQRQLTLKLADIEALPYEDNYVTLECISNQVGGELISNALWRSVALRDVLESAALQPAGRFLRFQSDDGYLESLPLSYALDPKVRLAYRMNDEPLNYKHGAPLRVLTPGKYGMKGPKWLRKISVIENDINGYWEERGWDQDAWLKTMSRIDVPAHGDIVQPGLIRVLGIAFAADRGISRVEVSEDGGASWHDAELAPALSRFAWTHWSYVWDALAGVRANFVVRATDGTGQLQTQETADPEPDGASGWHTAWIRVANEA